ncbi:MAG: response regulator [Microthrixaceae bacterium]
MPTRVVVAEDEAIIRMDLRELLQEEGYEVVGEAARGDQALALVSEQKPDVALLDIKMPGMDGISVACRVNAERMCAVVLVTAFSQRSSSRRPPTPACTDMS